MSNQEDDNSGIIDYTKLLPKFIPSEEDINFIHKEIPNEIMEELLKEWEKYKKKGYKIVIVNVNDINKLWKKTDYYIEPYSKTEKYINSKYDILQKKVKEPPIIHLDINNNIRFTNGRHRFANLRDNNVTAIPVLINQKKEFEKLCLINNNNNSKTKSKYTSKGGRKKTRRNKTKQ